MELNEFTLQRIAAMEAAFDRTAEAVKSLAAALDQYETVKVDIDRLTDYLDSGAWKEVQVNEQMQEICGPDSA